MAASPILLCPMPRTGGTLLVTMLDAHPEVAMSYEIYEDKLLDARGQPFDLRQVAASLAEALARLPDDTSRIRSLPDDHLRTFLFRAKRAGLELAEILEEIENHVAENGSLDAREGRLSLIERLMVAKMQKAGKTLWGGKTNTDPREWQRLRPRACFLAMVRDGRDVLASRRTTGAFSSEPLLVAREWTASLLQFQRFAALPGVRALAVRYERLVREPDTVMREVCAFIGVPYCPQVLQFHRLDLPLYRNSYGHLSSAQIAQGLNDRSIGRWRRDLAEDEVLAFETEAGGLLESSGYRRAAG